MYSRKRDIRTFSSFKESVQVSSRESSENIKVSIRVRPLLQKEIDSDAKVILTVSDNECYLVDPFAYGTAVKIADEYGHPQNSEMWLRKYAFDYCFSSADPRSEVRSDQESVFLHVGVEVVDNLLKGYNSTIFAYGQTGSGKSYTMLGKFGPGSCEDFCEEEGLIPRISREIFLQIDEISLSSSVESSSAFEVQVSYLEVYNEKIKDLLQASSNRSQCCSTKGLKIREDQNAGILVEGLTAVSVRSFEEIWQLIELGSRNRTVAQMNENSQSSRSHTLFTIRVNQRISTGRHCLLEKVSHLNLVDLAGSERIGNSKVVRTRLTETGYINKSLATLTDVVQALSTKAGSAFGSKPFIPYRNSTLTRLLKEGLGGNSKTYMIACLSPSHLHYDETLSTLKYAQRVRVVKTHARMNKGQRGNICIHKIAEHSGDPPNPPTWKTALLCNREGSGQPTATLSAGFTDLATESELKNLRKLLHHKEDTIIKLKEKMVGLCSSQQAQSLQKFAYALVQLGSNACFKEEAVFQLKCGVNRIGTDVTSDIRLRGEGILQLHAILDCYSDGKVYILSASSVSHTYVNGILLHSIEKNEQLLKEGDTIVFGQDQIFKLERKRALNYFIQPESLSANSEMVGTGRTHCVNMKSLK